MNNRTERLSETLSSNLVGQGFDRLTCVQTAALGVDAAQNDMVVLSPTGSGKTVAFGLSIAGALRADEAMPRAGRCAVVIVPTRELAMQVAGVLTRLYVGTGLRVAQCLPGETKKDTKSACPEPFHVLVTTPGKFSETARKTGLLSGGCVCIVLDEADELLSGDYSEDLKPVLERSHGDTWRIHLYSATRTQSLETTATQLLYDPVRIETAADAKSLPNVDLQAILSSQAERDRIIGSVLRLHHPERAIVFSNRRDDASRLAVKLLRRGFSVVNLNGALRSQQRFGAIERFAQGHARVCVATDIAARGLDIEDLGLIIHAGPPETAEVLLHRSGRAGRGGAPGRSVLVVHPDERLKTERLARQLGREIEWIAQPRPGCIRAADRQRVLSDPVFKAEPGEEDKTLARLIAEQFSLETISHACAHLWRKVQPMARDLERQEALQRRDEAVEWLMIEIRELTRADMGEILRQICSAAGIEKREIGRIHVGEGTARFEIPADLVEGILERAARGGEPRIWRD